MAKRAENERQARDGLGRRRSRRLARRSSVLGPRELGFQAFGEAADELRGDVRDHPAPVLGDGALQREVGDELDARAAVNRDEG